MVAYKNIVDQSESSKIELDQALLYVAYEIGIEFIHAKGPFAFFPTKPVIRLQKLFTKWKS